MKTRSEEARLKAKAFFDHIYTKSHFDIYEEIKKFKVNHKWVQVLKQYRQLRPDGKWMVTFETIQHFDECYKQVQELQRQFDIKRKKKQSNEMPATIKYVTLPIEDWEKMQEELLKLRKMVTEINAIINTL